MALGKNPSIHAEGTGESPTSAYFPSRYAAGGTNSANRGDKMGLAFPRDIRSATRSEKAGSDLC